MTRIPTEALTGPESLQNLQLQDNLIGKYHKKDPPFLFVDL